MAKTIKEIGRELARTEAPGLWLKRAIANYRGGRYRKAVAAAAIAQAQVAMLSASPVTSVTGPR